jgi:diguanylate cyclase (GGDEF)-like protein
VKFVSALRRLRLPASLRGQFSVAFAALTVLLFAAGCAALVTLQFVAQDIRQLTDVRLARLQESQDLLQRTLVIERQAVELLQAGSPADAKQAYQAISTQLDGFDEAVGRLADSAEDPSVLDLHQASELFRNSANVVAQLREAELQQPHGQVTPQPVAPAVAQTGGAVSLVRAELRRQADALVSVAQLQSERLTREYRMAVERLTTSTRRAQYTVLALFGAALVLAVLTAHLIGRLVLQRLEAVSRRLLFGRVDAAQPAQDVKGHDELSQMARAVERFLGDRHLLEVRSAELQHEAKVRQHAEHLQSAQARLLELIATSTPLEDVLAQLCYMVEAQLPGAVASVLVMAENGQRLRRGAAPSLPAGLVQALEQQPVSPDSHPCGRAASTRAAVVVPDLEADDSWAVDGAASVANGLRSCCSTPVLSPSQAVLGTFALYRRSPGEPGADERELIGLATHVAAIAIERHTAQQRIEHLAHHDVLTGLPNRLGLEERLQHALHNATERDRGVSLAYVDLDNFKFINDTLGHAAGDQVLQEVARRLQAGVRGADTVARLGGDEFLVLFTDQPSDHTALAARLQRLCEEVGLPIKLGDRSFRATCSMGVANYPRDAQDVATLLSCADTALYRAKDGGRNTFEFYSAELDARLQSQLALREDLGHAIERNELYLVYQPQVDLGSGEVVGVEALLRWRHPERGVVSPMDFIPLAESTGLIVPIGEWVLQTACRQNRAWQDAGLPPIRISVNVSARQLREPDWGERVAAVLSTVGLDPAWLDVELTESMIMENTEPAVACMRRLHQLGVGISIDDFGTGYSSLGSLTNFPITRLKIDKSFVWALHNEGGVAIVEAVIGLGHTLGLQVLAEGVETAKQQDFLRRAGCDEMQGYFFSKPVAPSEIEQLLCRRVEALQLS